MTKKPEPKDQKLYDKVVKEAKKKFKAWPSAYASGWVVKEYKRRGGTYKGKKPSKSQGLGRWFDEEWINVCKLPKKVPCGRPKTSLKEWKKTYPYCRPNKKVNSKTPKLASELSKKEIEKRCRKKRKNPEKRINPKSKSKSKSRSHSRCKHGKLKRPVKNPDGSVRYCKKR